MDELLLKDEAYAIIGAAMAVYNELGPGFPESIYQEALEIELNKCRIPNNPQYQIPVRYEDIVLKAHYVADFLAYQQIIVEIKALDQLTSREEGQLLSYLKATDCQLGLLVNFGAENNLEWKRMALTKTRKRHSAIKPYVKTIPSK